MKAAIVLFTLLLSLPLTAHPDPSHTLAQLEEHLAQSPDEPALLRQKAALLLGTGHPDLARPAIEKLAAIAPGDPENQLLEARLAFAENDPGIQAKAAALTVAHPGFATGWHFLARVEDAKGHRNDAIAAKLRALALEAKPGASDVMTCAAWLRDRGDTEQAIATLDQGLAKLGVLTGLHYEAIELELKLGRYDSALRRVDALAARFRPSVDLSLRRAGILEKAGRFKEAAASCDSALALMDALPAARKTSDVYREQWDAITKRKAADLDSGP